MSAALPRDPGALKQEIYALAARTNGGATATEGDRSEAAELIAALEASEGEPAPAKSALMAGVWDQVYTDNPQAGTVRGDGRSARRRLWPLKGTLIWPLRGFISGRVVQIIDYDEGTGTFRYAQRARAWRALGLQAKMRASVDPQPDGLTWRVNFEDLGWALLGGLLPLAPRKRLPPGSGGEWRTTFLDSEMRILRSRSFRGGPPTSYVLRRQRAADA